MPLGRLAFWIATAAALVFAGRAIFVEPPTLVMALGFTVAYLALLLCAVMIPALQVFGDVVCRGPVGDGRIAFTFDDGPDPEGTRRVLAALDAADARATFFVIGRKVETHPDVVQEIVERGHALGVHGYEHERLYAFKAPGDVAADIERTRDAIERAAGLRPELFRPPIGQVSPRTAIGAERARAVLVGWSVKGRDGLKSASVDGVTRRILRGMRDGAIVLLHDAAERDDRRPIASEVLPELLREARRRKLRPVTVEELLRT